MATPTHPAGFDPADPEPIVAPRLRPPLSLRLGNPTPTFRFLADLLAPIRLAVYLVWPLSVLACAVALFNWYDMLASTQRMLFTLSFLQNLVIGMLTANLLGKSAQGVVMSHYCVDSDEYGIRLAFGFIPRFYINRAAIRMLDFRAQRACYAAPILTKLAMFSLGTLGWAILLRSGSGAAEVLLTIASVGLGSLLFTLNPLWPADGYNWLAAALKRPRLRQHAMRVLGMVLTRRPVPPELGWPEFLLLLLYAVASIVFTALLAYLVLTAAAFALEAQLHGAGVVLFCLMLAMITVFLLSLMSNRRARRSRRSSGQPLFEP